MGFFDSKKKGSDPFRTLSEKEIQQRLYGHLKTEERLVEELSPKPQYQDNYSKSAPTIPARTSHATQQTQDLFKNTAVTEAAQSAPPSLSTGTLKVQSDKKSPLAFKESEVPKGSTRVVTPPAPKKPGLGEQFQRVFLPAAVVFFRTLGIKVVEILGVFVSGVYKIIQLIDFRKPAVRRIFSWVAGAAVLIGIFAAINSLNMKRETAMKEARVQAPVTAESKAKKEAAKKARAAEEKASQEAAKTAKKTPAVPAAATTKTPAASQENAAVTSAPANQGAYAIQVATFAAKADADNLKAKLEAGGLRSFVRSLTRPGGRVYQCVFLGRFATYDEAETNLAEFKKHESAKPFQDAFVRTL